MPDRESDRSPAQQGGRRSSESDSDIRRDDRISDERGAADDEYEEVDDTMEDDEDNEEDDGSF